MSQALLGICDNAPLADPNYLNHPHYSWPSDRVVVSLISGQGYFIFLYGRTKQNIHNREGGSKENKQTRSWASSKCKKGDFVTLLCSSPCIASVYSSEIPTKSPGMLMLTALSCRLPCSVHFSVLHLSLDCRLPPTFVRYPFLSTDLFFLLTDSGTFLPSYSSGLVGDLARKPFVWVSRQNRQRNLLTGTYPHPQKWMPPIVSQI